MKILIIPETDLSIDIKDYDLTVKLDESFCEKQDIFCFIPNRDLVLKSNQNICFIAYGPNTFEYKHRARGHRYRVGDDNFIMLDSNFTWPIHRNVGLTHTEELNILIYSIEFFISQGYNDITISKISELQPLENEYMEKLIKENNIKVLNE